MAVAAAVADRIGNAVALGLPIQGWKTAPELEWLARQADRSRFILDVGCWKGQTTKVMAAVCRGTVVAVDHASGPYSGETGRNEILQTRTSVDIIREFTENLKQELLDLRVTAIFENGPAARNAVRELAGHSRFDFVWLDGDHGYPDVRDDILAYRALIAPGGILAGHDYDRSFPGVMQAVDELCLGFLPGPHNIWALEVP